MDLQQNFIKICKLPGAHEVKMCASVTKHASASLCLIYTFECLDQILSLCRKDEVIKITISFKVKHLAKTKHSHVFHCSKGAPMNF